jgi:hypothetical protein
MQYFAVLCRAGYTRHRICDRAHETGKRDGESPRWNVVTVRPSEERLDSWKDIAAYLNRDVTVQRLA